MIYLKYIKNLVKDNPIKIVSLILLIISFVGIKRVDYDNKTCEVLYSIVDKSKDEPYIYFFKDGDEYRNKSFEKKIEIEKGKIKFSEFSNTQFGLGIAISIFALIFIVGLLSDDGDTGWEFKEIWEKTRYQEIKCDEENGNYYYHLDGRLIHKSDYLITDLSSLKGAVRSYMISKDLFPIYNGTKSQKRSKKLEKLGVM